MSSPAKVLIVDDSKVVRTAIARYLRAFPVEVVGAAEDGLEALRLFEETDPDIVTLDITMPGLDGIGVLEGIQKSQSTAKVIVVSALGDDATKSEAIRLGAAAYICKPLTVAGFRRVLAEVANLKPTEEQA